MNNKLFRRYSMKYLVILFKNLLFLLSEMTEETTDMTSGVNILLEIENFSKIKKIYIEK